MSDEAIRVRKAQKRAEKARGNKLSAEQRTDEMRKIIVAAVLKQMKDWDNWVSVNEIYLAMNKALDEIYDVMAIPKN